MFTSSYEQERKSANLFLTKSSILASVSENPYFNEQCVLCVVNFVTCD